jgi:hypothetical protein
MREITLPLTLNHRVGGSSPSQPTERLFFELRGVISNVPLIEAINLGEPYREF